MTGRRLCFLQASLDEGAPVICDYTNVLVFQLGVGRGRGRV